MWRPDEVATRPAGAKALTPTRDAMKARVRNMVCPRGKGGKGELEVEGKIERYDGIMICSSNKDTDSA
jgi:hypothetical protein